MRGLLLAALVEAGIITWRDLSQDKILPMPSDYVAVALFYGGLGVFPASAATFTSLVGWGIVLATFLNLWDPTNPTKLILPGQAKQVSAPAGSGSLGSGPVATPGSTTVNQGTASTPGYPVKAQ